MYGVDYVEDWPDGLKRYVLEEFESIKEEDELDLKVGETDTSVTLERSDLLENINIVVNSVYDSKERRLTIGVSGEELYEKIENVSMGIKERFDEDLDEVEIHRY